MEIKGSAAALARRWGWGGLASGIACLLLLLGGVTVQSAVAGEATEAMKGTIDETLKIISNSPGEWRSADGDWSRLSGIGSTIRKCQDGHWGLPGMS
jgi:hypothetical protein